MSEAHQPSRETIELCAEAIVLDARLITSIELTNHIAEVVLRCAVERGFYLPPEWVGSALGGFRELRDKLEKAEREREELRYQCFTALDNIVETIHYARDDIKNTGTKSAGNSQEKTQ